MIISVVFFAAASVLVYRTSRIRKKEKEIKYAYDFALKKFNVGESITMGAGSTALSLFDIYASCENHSQVLEVLEYRFNNAIGQATSVDWYNKIEELIKHGDRAIDTYVSAYSGQAGENATVNFFNSHGQNAELFESRTHPDNDVILHGPFGSHTEYSVKSYSDLSELKRAIANHPGSTHYAINSELYNQLENKGLIEQYHSQGIDIIDGHFSNIDNRHKAVDAFNDIHNAGDVAHHVPIIGLAIFGVKTIKNFSKYQNNQQSGYEFGVNMVGDFAGVGARTVVGMGGAKVGAVIGTMITPGIGTIIGGGIGAIAGAVAASGVVEWLKEKFKWGDIIATLDYYGDMFKNGFDSKVKDKIKNSLLGYPEVIESLKEEKVLLEKYEEQLNPKSKNKITLPAILCKIQYDRLNRLVNDMDSIVNDAENSIYTLCRTAAIQRGGSKDKIERISKRLLGELVINNPDIFLEDRIDYYKNDTYWRQVNSSPNHPYRFSQNPKDIVHGLIYKSYFDRVNGYSDEYSMQSHLFSILFILLFIVVGIYFL